MAMMNCPGCGKEATDASAKCPYCGTDLHPNAPKRTVRLSANPPGIIGFVLALLCFIYFAIRLRQFAAIFPFMYIDYTRIFTVQFLIGLAIVVLCALGITQAKKRHWGTGLAIAGLVLAGLSTIGSAAMILFLHAI